MRGYGLIVLGFILTGLFLYLVYWLASQSFCFDQAEIEVCISKFQKFLESPPNEQGDTLAGLAGALAFLWIIITVMMQGRELALQRNEIEKMRETQQEQTNLLKLGSERQIKSDVDAKIRAMFGILETTLPDLGFRKFELATLPVTHPLKATPVFFIDPSTQDRKDARDPKFWSGAIKSIQRAVRSLREERGLSVVSPSIPISWYACLSQADSIVNEANGATEAVQEWVLHDLKLPLLARVLKEALEDDLLWSAHSGDDA